MKIHLHQSGSAICAFLRTIPVVSFLILYSAVCLTAQSQWYVRAGATPGENADGKTWATAFPDLQLALRTARSGDEVWIARGIYTPTADKDRNKRFELSSGIKLYGGFAGTETSLGQRDWTANPTILSGDIGLPNDSTDNSYTILYVARATGDTRIDGLIVERGVANNPDDVNVFSHLPSQSGGGLYMDAQTSGQSTYLLVENCIFRQNWADHMGGAIFVNLRDGGSGTIRLKNTVFQRNRCGSRGGALLIECYQRTGIPTLIEGCTFEENISRVGGGALYFVHQDDVNLKSVTFRKNNVQFGGGGAALQFEGPMRNRNIEIDQCQFLDYPEQDFDASVIYIFDNPTSENGPLLNIRNSRFWRQVGGGLISGFYQGLMVNCMLTENEATPNHCLFFGTGQMSLVNCTLVDNNGKFRWPELNISLTNCIWLGRSQSAGQNITNKKIRLANCLTNLGTCEAMDPNAVCSNVLFGADPMFVDPGKGNFQLQPCSPAINAGLNRPVDSLRVLTDGAGLPRRSGGLVDIGAFECQQSARVANIRPVSCGWGTDGSVAFTHNLCEPVRYTWRSSSGATGTEPNNLVAGNYSFTLTDARGSRLSVPNVPVVQPEPLSHSFSIQQPTIGMNNGAIRTDVKGGVPPYTWRWNSGQATANINNVGSGDYLVTVTDATNCTLTIFFQLRGVVSAAEPDGAPGTAARLMPNPVGAGQPFSIGPDGAEVTIFDVLGRQMSRTTRPGEQPVAPASAGMYGVLIRLKNGGAGRMLTLQVIDWQ
jgi:hypothetical protein